MDGPYGALADKWGDAARNAARLAGHHEAMGESEPSKRNPATRVGEFFDELEPYLSNE